jgi:hypothetical protein
MLGYFLPAAAALRFAAALSAALSFLCFLTGFG